VIADFQGRCCGVARICTGSLLTVFCVLWGAAIAHAQTYGGRIEGWGQTYRPAGILNMEARVNAHPWLSAETQVWTGRSPLAPQGNGDVLVLSLRARDPTGHGDVHAGRFVLSSGAVRPVHLDGAHLRGRLDSGTQLEGFAGVPVTPAFAKRAYDWLAGGRLSQQIGTRGTLGVSYVERRDAGREMDEELGADLVLYAMPWLSVAGRSSYDLVSRGLSELNVTGSLGSVERRLELFGVLRNPSLILPATSLFSVLSNTPSLQTGASGRLLVAPRLRLEALAAYRDASGERGVHAEGSGTLWLDDERASAIEGTLTRDGVRGSEWTGARVTFYRDVLAGLRVSSELELVRPDDSHGKGRLWPWGRLAARYTLREAWQLSAGFEGSASPTFTRLFQALFGVSYQLGST
jgi:hypothetical protein